MIKKEKDIYNLTNKECEILIRLLNSEKSNNMTSAIIAKNIKVSRTNPYFFRILSILIELGIITIVQIGATKIYNIDNDKLSNFIDEQKVTNFWYEYFNSHHICKW